MSDHYRPIKFTDNRNRQRRGVIRPEPLPLPDPGRPVRYTAWAVAYFMLAACLLIVTPTGGGAIPVLSAAAVALIAGFIAAGKAGAIQ